MSNFRIEVKSGGVWENAFAIDEDHDMTFKTYAEAVNALGQTLFMLNKMFLDGVLDEVVDPNDFKIVALKTQKLTLAVNHCMDIGDKLSVMEPDANRFRRFMCWILRRPAPTKLATYRIEGTPTSNTLIVSRIV